jgi:hypothetical protein
LIEEARVSGKNSRPVAKVVMIHDTPSYDNTATHQIS